MDQDQFQLGRTKIFIKAPESVSSSSILCLLLFGFFIRKRSRIIYSKKLETSRPTFFSCIDAKFKSCVKSLLACKGLFECREKKKTWSHHFYTKHHKRALMSQIVLESLLEGRRLNPTLVPRQHWVNTTLELKHKHRLWLQCFGVGVGGGHHKGLSFSTITTFFMIPMKAALVWCLCCHLLTRTCSHTDVCLEAYTQTSQS